MNKPKMQVHILHFCHRILIFHPVIQRFCHILNSRSASLFQNFSSLTLCKYIRSIGKIPFFQRLSMTHKKSTAFHPPRQTVFCKFSHKAPDRHRDFIKSSMFKRFTVNIISSEQFIRSFTRKHNFYFLCRFFTQKIQCNRRRIRHRLIHIILNIRKTVPVFIRRDHLRIILHMNTFGKIFCILNLTVFSLVKSDCKRMIDLSQISQVTGIHSA